MKKKLNGEIMAIMNLKSKKEVFEEARRVSTVKRWAHLALLYQYAHEVFEVSAKEFVEECELDMAPSTLTTHAYLARNIYVKLPKAMQKKAKISICKSVQMRVHRKDLTYNNPTVRKLFAEVLKEAHNPYKIDSYFAAARSLARMLEADSSIIDRYDADFIARTYEEISKLDSILKEVVHRRLKWSAKEGKFIARTSK
jgi:hypothetical protein